MLPLMFIWGVRRRYVFVQVQFWVSYNSTPHFGAYSTLLISVNVNMIYDPDYFHYSRTINPVLSPAAVCLFASFVIRRDEWFSADWLIASLRYFKNWLSNGRTVSERMNFMKQSLTKTCSLCLSLVLDQWESVVEFVVKTPLFVCLQSYLVHCFTDRLCLSVFIYLLIFYITTFLQSSYSDNDLHSAQFAGVSNTKGGPSKVLQKLNSKRCYGQTLQDGRLDIIFYKFWYHV